MLVYWIMTGISPSEQLKNALEQAKKNSCLVWLHIHAQWCPYSQLWRKEVLEDASIIKLKENFVYLEWNRDEVPHWDDSAQTLLQLQKSASGWPLNIFLLPSGKAILGMTAPQTRSFHPLLTQLIQAELLDPNSLEQQASSLMQNLTFIDPLQSDRFHAAESCAQENLQNNQYENILWDRLLTPLSQSLDPQSGWIGQDKIFHYPAVYGALLEHEQTKTLSAQALTQLARTQLCDVIGGGFFRAAFFEDKNNPNHGELNTEKLLQENAELLEIYVEAWHKNQSKFFSQICSEITRNIMEDFQLRSFVGFSSALSSSTLYYRLTAADLLESLNGGQRLPAQLFFGLDGRSSVPTLPVDLLELSKQLQMPPVDLQNSLLDAQKKLRIHRKSKNRIGHPTALPRQLESEATAVRALLKAALAFENLGALLSASISTSAWEQLADHCFSTLVDWTQSKWFQNPVEQLQARPKWSVIRAWLMAARYDLESSQKNNKSRNSSPSEWLDFADRLMNQEVFPGELSTATPFLGNRLDFHDHVGYSAAAQRFHAWVDRYEIALLRNESALIEEIEEFLPNEFAASLEYIRPLGIHASGIYFAWARWQNKKKKRSSEQ